MDTTNPEVQIQEPQVQFQKLELPFWTPSEVALRRIALGGIVFLVLAVLALAAVVFMLCFSTITQGDVGISSDVNASRMLLHIFFVTHLAPILSFLVGLVAAAIGYMLLRAAGTASREVLPKQDYPLLSRMLLEGNQDGITNYIRLSSLTGTIGMFTKLGISGLPLATIFLTILFAILGLIIPGQSSLFDLAKLTLGAFIGSYVQRQSGDTIRTVTQPTASEQQGPAGGNVR